MQETVKKVLNGDFNRKKALLFLITALLGVPTLILIVWQWRNDRRKAAVSKPAVESEASV